jgi:hypothetical protein
VISVVVAIVLATLLVLALALLWASSIAFVKLDTQYKDFAKMIETLLRTGNVDRAAKLCLAVLDEKPPPPKPKGEAELGRTNLTRR